MSQLPPDPPPSWRKPAGIFMILGLIIAWAAIIVALSPWVGSWGFCVFFLNGPLTLLLQRGGRRG